MGDGLVASVGPEKRGAFLLRRRFTQKVTNALVWLAQQEFGRAL